MKRNFLPYAIIVIAASVMLAIALYIPNSLPVNSDFSAIYYADLALVRGVHIYNIPAVESIALKESGIPSKFFFLPRFPYPPWFALSTFYLGLLPIRAAATLWFELNLVMLFFSIWLLTDQWPRRMRLISFPLALLFLPIIGTLSVGQYDFPTLLGTALLLFSLRKENAILSALGAALLTFKPHIGGLILLSALIYLLLRKDNFGRRALRFILIVGIFLFIVGFIADPAWPINYPGMLFNYQNEGNVTSCSECASLPILLSRWFFDGSLTQAIIIAVVLLLVFVLLLFLFRSELLKSPALFLTFSLLITLIVSPYLYNYDFMLLLIPLMLLINTKKVFINKILIILCYIGPTFAIALLGREGNPSLILATFLLASLFCLHARNISSIDIPTY